MSWSPRQCEARRVHCVVAYSAEVSLLGVYLEAADVKGDVRPRLSIRLRGIRVLIPKPYSARGAPAENSTEDDHLWPAMYVQ